MEALIANDKQGRDLDQSVKTFACTVSTKGIIKSVSNTFQGMTGMTRNSVINKPLRQILHDGDIVDVYMIFGQSNIVKENVSTKVRCKTKNGGYLTCDITVLRFGENGSEGMLLIFSRDILSALHEEQALREREDRLKIHFEYAPDAYYSIDLKGNILDGNLAAEEMIGYKREKLIGKNFLKLDLLPKNQIPKALMLLGQNMLGRPTGPDEFTLNRKDGSKIHVEIRTFPIKMKGKTVVLSIARDITEKKKVLDALKVSEEKFRNLVETAQELIWRCDTEGRFIYLNPAWEFTHGYKLEEMLDRPFSDFQHPDVFERDRIEFGKHLAGGSITGYETSHLRKDGSEISLLFNAMPLLDADENIVGSQGTATDITERKQTEKSLKASEKKYRNLVEKSNLGIYILQENKFKYANETFEKITGYSFEEVSSDSFNFMELIAPESNEFISHRNISREKGEKIDDHYSFKGITKTGNIIDLEVNTSVSEYEGKPAIHGIIRDITAQIQDRQEKLELQEKLKQSERMESLGLLAGGVAHDLNNIIGPIMAYPDLIRMDLEEGKPVDKDLDTIKYSAQRAADVVADLLALTRRGSYKMLPLELNTLVKDYLSSAEYEATKRLHPEVVTNEQLSDDKLMFKGSNAHLPKIIMNLVNNAFESMPEGGVVSIITSSIKVEDGGLSDAHIPAGRYNLLIIKDQGEGISKENLSKIFDPFFTTKMKTGKSGTGLGLSVVYNVLKDHGAHVDIDSKLGIGTKFSVYFPQTTDKIQPTFESRINIKGSGRILVVDDREEQRDIATRLLTKLGYEVESVDRGQAAIKYLKKKDVDLLLLDMILEDGMDGLDTYKEIIKIKPDQKTIIVSGYSESDRVKEAAKLGVNGFIQKPYKLIDIGKLISTVISNQPQTNYSHDN